MATHYASMFVVESVDFWFYLWRLWYWIDYVYIKQTYFMQLPRHLYFYYKHLFCLFMLSKHCYWPLHSLFLVYTVIGKSKPVLCSNNFEIEQKLYTGNSAKHMATTPSTFQKCLIVPVHTKPIYPSNPSSEGSNNTDAQYFFSSQRADLEITSSVAGCGMLTRSPKNMTSISVISTWRTV